MKSDGFDYFYDCLKVCLQLGISSVTNFNKCVRFIDYRNHFTKGIAVTCYLAGTNFYCSS